MVDRMPPARGGRNLRIELGHVHLPWEKATELSVGKVVSLESLVDEPVDLFVGERLIGRGEVLVLDGCFCIRVTQLPRQSNTA